MADIQNNSFLTEAYREFMEAEGVTGIPDKETQRMMKTYQFIIYEKYIYIYIYIIYIIYKINIYLYIHLY